MGHKLPDSRACLPLLNTAYRRPIFSRPLSKSGRCEICRTIIRASSGKIQPSILKYPLTTCAQVVESRNHCKSHDRPSHPSLPCLSRHSSRLALPWRNRQMDFRTDVHGFRSTWRSVVRPIVFTMKTLDTSPEAIAGLIADAKETLITCDGVGKGVKSVVVARIYDIIEALAAERDGERTRASSLYDHVCAIQHEFNIRDVVTDGDLVADVAKLFAERDELRAKLAESEAYAAKQEKLAIEFSTRFDTAQQQLTAAQARVAELERLAQLSHDNYIAYVNLFKDSQAREQRLREAVTKAEDYVFALVNPDNQRNGTVLAALAALRAALAQSPAAQKGGGE